MSVEKWQDWAEQEARYVAAAIKTAQDHAPPSCIAGLGWARIVIAGVDALAEFRTLFAEFKPDAS